MTYQRQKNLLLGFPIAVLSVLVLLVQSDIGWNVLPDGTVRYCWYEWHPNDFGTDEDAREVLHCVIVGGTTS